MKSRRELLAGFFIDIAKAIFIASVIGGAINGGLFSWPMVLIGIIVCVHFIVLAWNIYPEAKIDKELEIWKKLS